MCNQNEARRLRLEYTQQEIFQAIKSIGERSDDERLAELVNQKWFTSYDINRIRLLPDGSTTPGAPFPADLTLRYDIVDKVLDGLKSRPREGKAAPAALFKVQLYEYDLLLALCQTYQVAERMIRSEEIDVYEASTLCTAAQTMIHVAAGATTSDATAVSNASDFTTEDYEACEL